MVQILREIRFNTVRLNSYQKSLNIAKYRLYVLEQNNHAEQDGISRAEFSHLDDYTEIKENENK